MKAPLEKGTIVGKAYVVYDGKKMEGFKPINVVTSQSVEEGELDSPLFPLGGG